jgi:hypothetical protein
MHRGSNAIEALCAAGVAGGDYLMALAAMIVARLHAVGRTARVLLIGGCTDREEPTHERHGL